MFVLGFVCGLCVLAFVMWLHARYAHPHAAPGADSYDELHAIERRTIRDMLDAELAARNGDDFAARVVDIRRRP